MENTKVLEFPIQKSKRPEDTPAMKRHLKAIASGRMEKNQIHALCHALNGVKRVNLGSDGIHDRQRLLNALNDHINERGEIRITKEQTRIGIDWLRKHCFRKDGSRRKTKDFPFNDHEVQVIRNFAKFRFVGVYNSNGSRYAYRSGYFRFSPIYRVYAKDGSHFDYTVPGLWEKNAITLSSGEFFYAF